MINIEMKVFKVVSFGLCVSVYSRGYAGIPVANVTATAFVLVVM